MKQHSNLTKQYFLPVKTITVLVIIISVIGFMSFGFRNEAVISNTKDEKINKDSVASVKAFKDVYTVLMSPRCMNCHPSGDVPLQGDDSHLHKMLPKRGKDGKGIDAMKCSNCHQPTNIEGLNTPPGHAKSQLPPATLTGIYRRQI